MWCRVLCRHHVACFASELLNEQQVTPLLAVILLSAQTVDTVHIDEVTKVARSTKRAMVSLSADSIVMGATNFQNISDVLKLQPSVAVKDYGGIGGMKTISVRSFGSQHTQISIDCIPQANAQTGAIDLGVFPLNTTKELNLSIIDNADMLLPARSVAAASLLNIQGADIVANSDYAAAFCEYGEFGTIRPYVSINKHISSDDALFVSASLDRTEGDYTFELKNADTTTSHKRQNGDARQVRLQADYQHVGNVGMKSKIYYYDANRGLPRATTYYNLISHERLTDRNLIAQTSVNKHVGVFALSAFARYNYLLEEYKNPDALGSSLAEAKYAQNEVFAGFAAMTSPINSLIVSAAADIANSRLCSEQVEGSPMRNHLNAVLRAKYVYNNLLATASLIATTYHDKNAETRHRLNAAASLAYAPFEWLNVHTAYKKSERLPSFNDLYYSGVGSRSLLPEQATQFDVGTQISTRTKLVTTSFSADYYHNNITDKIVAIPTKNIFVWSMMNVGKVEIDGVDMSLDANCHISNDINIRASANSSYQHSIDVTDRSSNTYGHQIAYIPRIAYGGMLLASIRWFSATYALQRQGKRYVLNQNTTENRLEGFTDQSVSVMYANGCKSIKYQIALTCRNVADAQYEVVKNFPMPGRSFAASVKITYK